MAKNFMSYIKKNTNAVSYSLGAIFIIIIVILFVFQDALPIIGNTAKKAVGTMNKKIAPPRNKDYVQQPPPSVVKYDTGPSAMHVNDVMYSPYL